MKVKKFQMGGQVAPEAEQAPAGGGEEQILAMSEQIISQLGPEAAAMLADAIMAMLQGGGAPQEAPVYARQGGKLVKVNKR